MNTQTQTPLAPFEAAARIYCMKAGVDPDEPVPVQHPLGLAVAFSVPAWQLEAERLVDLSRMLSALRDAANAQKVIVS